MGRWSQSRLRGGGGGATSSPTPNPVTLIDVHGDGTDWVLTFDGAIEIDPAAAPSSEFSVDGATTDPPAVAVGAACSLTDSDGSYISGRPWDLTAQPPWLLTPIAGPQSGTTT
jgi:hypothetical protein